MKTTYSIEHFMNNRMESTIIENQFAKLCNRVNGTEFGTRLSVEQVVRAMLTARNTKYYAKIIADISEQATTYIKDSEIVATARFVTAADTTLTEVIEVLTPFHVHFGHEMYYKGIDANEYIANTLRYLQETRGIVNCEFCADLENVRWKTA